MSCRQTKKQPTYIYMYMFFVYSRILMSVAKIINDSIDVIINLKGAPPDCR
jgi:hypothetical protein